MAKVKEDFDSLVASIPRKISTADVFMNLNKLPPQHGRQLEAADKTIETQGEGDSLMGRLAMRMASRDMIDELTLGPKGKAPAAKQAQVADMSNMKFPTRMNVSGPAVSKGAKIEKEHKGTVDKVKKKPTMKNEEVYENIAKDHLKEHKGYYDEKKGLPAMERGLESQDLVNTCPAKMILGAGLFQQTTDIKASNANNNHSLEANSKNAVEGSNMADQARANGNVYDTMHKRGIEQQKSLPKLNIR